MAYYSSSRCILVAFFIVHTLVACGLTSRDPGLEARDPHFPISENSSKEWWVNNPCGWLPIRKPLFNVTGQVTGAVRPNSSLFLLVAPNASIETALWTVRTCTPLGRIRVDAEGHFDMLHLPVGKYLVMLPRSAFGETQGFPIIREYNSSNYSVRLLWHGGDPYYSVSAFVVEHRSHSQTPPS
jgi:hypothetical protein